MECQLQNFNASEAFESQKAIIATYSTIEYAHNDASLWKQLKYLVGIWYVPDIFTI